MDYKRISADSHVNEPPHTWQARLPERLKAAGPRLVRLEDGGDGWTYEGRVPRSFGLGVVAGRNPEDFKERGIRFEDLLPGNWDAAAHLVDQDLDGVDASVLYPGGAGMGLYSTTSKELRLASMRAYNDWLAEEFVSVNPARLVGLAVLPVDDAVEEAAAELWRAVDKGLRGGLIPTWPAERNYSDPVFDPLWSAAQELDVPLSFHRSAGRGRGANLTPSGSTVAGIVIRYFVTMEPLTEMVFSGVFARFPRLRIVSAESDFGWFAFLQQLCDDQYRRQRHWSKLPIQEAPSAYFRRNVFATFMDDEVGVHLRSYTGADNFLWASDYPHSVTTWPKSSEYIQRQMGDCTDEERAKLLAGNTVRVYRLDA